MKKIVARVHPLSDIGPRLLDIEKPARYLGGELGAMKPSLDDTALQIGLCFPDLYEIGMSNNAIRILYSELNASGRIRCERVFAPAPDFEKLLVELNLPLYTLESGLSLCDLDILGFSLGYELAATSVLAVLSAGKIPLLHKDRGQDDPLVIMGGPAISNPHPFASFVDACYIGEAEASFFSLMDSLADIKAQGGVRSDLLEMISRDGAMWFPLDSPYRKTRAPGIGEGGTLARRAVFTGFAGKVYHTGKPVATLKAVQDHGTVEIMRGCPNGCRFCHAGYYYRPQRVKLPAAIRQEVAELVENCGYREITLASLSSGDYPGIGELLDALNDEWGAQGVSFQLPSLKISSFNLPLLEKISEIRKSGLTLAVETPIEAWQRIINKDVSFEQTASILSEAKAKGFRHAKFYFMIGLPVPGGAEAEADAIIDFFFRLHSRVQIQLNVNIGTFVPKAHTPFQWARQLTEEESQYAVRKIKDGLRRSGAIKVSYHSPFVSVLEGVISRGDERVGDLLLDAFHKGARLDAWDEHFKQDLWKEVLTSASWDVLGETSAERPTDKALAWDDIAIGVGSGYLKREWQRALSGEFTSACKEKCTEPCGACADGLSVVQENVAVLAEKKERTVHPATVSRILFAFTKQGSARFLPHLAIVEALIRAFQITKTPMQFSSGFNPMPRLELVQPLAIGVSSRAEVASMLLYEKLEGGYSDEGLAWWTRKMNEQLPEGMKIHRAEQFEVIEGKKIHSLNGLSWGGQFALSLPAKSSMSLDKIHSRLTAAFQSLAITGASADNLVDCLMVCIPDPMKKEESLLRILESIIETRPIQACLDIERTACLAHVDGDQAISYEDAFRYLYASSP